MSKSMIHYMWQTATISKSFSFLKHLLLFFKLFLDQEMSENYQTKWRIGNRSTSKNSWPLGRLGGFPSGQFQKTAGQFSKTAGQIGRLGHKYQALPSRSSNFSIKVYCHRDQVIVWLWATNICCNLMEWACNSFTLCAEAKEKIGPFNKARIPSWIGKCECSSNCKGCRRRIWT